MGLGPFQRGVDYPDKATAALAVDVSSSDVNLATAFNAGYARWLNIGTSGTVTAQQVGDASGVQYTCVAGERLEGKFIKVFHSGTSATGIVAQN